MATESIKTPRIVTRGEKVLFRASFFEDANQTVPLSPLNSSLYPSYVIKDINGATVQSGIALQDQNAGAWKVEYFVGKEVSLSHDLKRWRIEWTFVTNNNRQVEFVEEFDVRDVIITASQSREIKKIALCDRQFLASFRTTTRPSSLKLELLLGNGKLPLKGYGTMEVTGTGAQGGWSSSDIRETAEGDSFLYTYVVPENTIVGEGQYNLLWTVQETPHSQFDYEFQSVFAVPPTAFHALSSVRMLIDRFQKRLGRVQAYEDADIYEYLVQGLGVINGWYPTTKWQMTTLPGVLHHFWFMAAGWWGLNAQHILEVDMGFNFSGQTVTLDYDHTAGLDAAIGRFADYLNNHLTPAKMALVRAMSPVGAFAGRPVRLRALHNFVFKIDSTPAGNFMDMLSKIGLL